MQTTLTLISPPRRCPGLRSTITICLDQNLDEQHAVMALRCDEGWNDLFEEGWTVCAVSWSVFPLLK